MLTESIAFFKNYDRLHSPAQDADVRAYVYSDDLWEDIDLQEDPLRQAPIACQCQNPFCENHATQDEDLNQEWASMEQQPSRPEKHAITSDPTDHSQKRQKLTVLEHQSPKTVTLRASLQVSTLWRKRLTCTRDVTCGSAETMPPACSQTRLKLTILKAHSPKTITIRASPHHSTLWLRRRARTRAHIHSLVACPPPPCSDPACPLNRPPYRIPARTCTTGSP